MYQFTLNFLLLLLVLSCVVAALTWAVGQYFKMGAETTVSLGVQTGDSESMNFTTNFKRGQTHEERMKTAQGLYDVVHQRRTANHEEYLRVKAQAIADNEAAAAKGEGDSKLRSITEGSKKGS